MPDARPSRLRELALQMIDALPQTLGLPLRAIPLVPLLIQVMLEGVTLALGALGPRSRQSEALNESDVFRTSGTPL